MTISFKAAGASPAATVSATAVPLAYPTPLTGDYSGDLAILGIGGKPHNSVFVRPAGYFLIGEGTNGTTAIGADVGATHVGAFGKIMGGDEVAGGTSMTTVSVTSGNTTGGAINCYTKDRAKQWDFATFTIGQDTTNAANYSATGAATIPLQAGDVLLAITAVNGDIGTPSAFGLTVPGIVLGTVTQRQNSAHTTGNDTRFLFFDVPVTSGTATGAPTFTYTNASNQSGTTIFIRLREVDPVYPGRIAGVEPESNGHTPPMQDGNGAIYRVTEAELDSGNEPRMMKSTDQGKTWYQAGLASRPDTGDLESSWQLQHGTTISFFWSPDSTATFAQYATSDAATGPDTWIVPRETAFTGLSSSGVHQYASMTRTSDGQFWLFVPGLLAGANNQISYRRRTGVNTYGAIATLDDGAGVNLTQPTAVLGANDLTYLFYKDDTNNVLYYRTLTAAGVLSARTSVATGLHGVAGAHTNAVYYDDAGVEVITITYLNSTLDLISREIRGGVLQAAQTITTTDVLQNPGVSDSQGVVAHLSVDAGDKKVIAIWSDSASGDLLYSKHTNAGAWSTPTVLLPSASSSVWWTYGNVFARGSNVILGFTHDMGTHTDPESFIQYDEIVLRQSGISGSSAGVLPTMGGAGAGTVSTTGASSGVLAALTGAATATVTALGTSAAILAALTGAGTGTVDSAIYGSSAGVLSTLSGSASADVRLVGTSAGTLSVLTGSAAADVRLTGSGSGTLAGLTGSGAAAVRTMGTSAASLPVLTSTASADVRLTGSGSGSLAPLTGSGTAAVRTLGTSAASLPDLIGSGAAAVRMAGSSSGTLAPLTSASGGDVRTSGAGTGTLPALTGTGSGVVTNANTGQSIGFLPALTGSGAAAVRTLGSSAASLPNLTGSGAGTSRLNGSSAATLPALTGTGSADVSAPVVGSSVGVLPTLLGDGDVSLGLFGSGVASLPSLTGSGQGTVLGDAGLITTPPSRTLVVAGEVRVRVVAAESRTLIASL